MANEVWLRYGYVYASKTLDSYGGIMVVVKKKKKKTTLFACDRQLLHKFGIKLRRAICLSTIQTSVPISFRST